MKGIILFLVLLSAGITQASEVPFPRKVVCGKVADYQYKSKNGLTLTVEFEGASVLSYNSQDDYTVESVPAQIILVRSVTVKDKNSKSLLKNSSLTVSIAKALKQSFCLDTKVLEAGEFSIVAMGKSDDERSALDQVTSLWK